MKKMFVGIVAFACCCVAPNAFALDKTATGFYWPIGKSSFNQKCGTWLNRDSAHGGCYFSGKYHIGVDMMTGATSGVGSEVYAISDGEVIYKHCDDYSWGHGNCALFIRHKLFNADEFVALYGHIRTSLNNGNKVYAGKIIGRTGEWGTGIHLHFGIIPENNVPGTDVSNGIGWGMMGNQHWNKLWPNKTNHFVDPIKFLQDHAPYLDLSDDSQSREFNVKAVDNYAWYPPNVDCFDAVYWFELLPDRCIQRDRSICFELQGTCPAIQ